MIHGRAAGSQSARAIRPLEMLPSQCMASNINSTKHTKGVINRNLFKLIKLGKATTNRAAQEL